jgi:hypothetical protein
VLFFEVRSFVTKCKSNGAHTTLTTLQVLLLSDTSYSFEYKRSFVLTAAMSAWKLIISHRLRVIPFFPYSLVFIYIDIHKSFETHVMYQWYLCLTFTPQCLNPYFPWTDSGKYHHLYHGTLLLTPVHTYVGHLQGLKALCSEFAYSFKWFFTLSWGNVASYLGVCCMVKLVGSHLITCDNDRNWARIINLGLLSIPWLNSTRSCVWSYLLCVVLTVSNRRGT